MARLPLRQRDAHDQHELARPRARLVDELGELGLGIEHEVAHRVAMEGLADRGARAHGMHVVDRRLAPEHRAHERDLRRRGAVEMAHAAVAQRAQHARVGVALHGIERVAGEARDEAARGAAQRRRAQRVQRLLRALARHDIVERGKDRRRGEHPATAKGGDGDAKRRPGHLDDILVRRGARGGSGIASTRLASGLGAPEVCGRRDPVPPGARRPMDGRLSRRDA